MQTVVSKWYPDNSPELEDLLIKYDLDPVEYMTCALVDGEEFESDSEDWCISLLLNMNSWLEENGASIRATDVIKAEAGLAWKLEEVDE